MPSGEPVPDERGRVPPTLPGLTTAGPRLFFTRGAHLWKSDGTAAGTRDMGVIGPNWPNMLVAVGAKLCFAEFDYEAQTWTLWQSDGTKAGTHPVKSFANPDAAAWYRARLLRHFRHVGGGVLVRRGYDPLLWELERPWPQKR